MEAQHQQGRVAANAVMTDQLISFEAPQTSGLHPCEQWQLQITPSVLVC